MCGIAGYAGRSSKDELERMMRAIEHRGPDDRGILVRENVGLGHLRLAIIDVSPRGAQPMVREEEDIAIILNGEIYNFKELRKELEAQGRTFRSDSDTEVLLHLYAVHGETFLEKTVGMFAIALYDFKQKKLILARDRMGEKPLYWSQEKGALRFASELRALMVSDIEKKLNLDALQQYLQFDYVPTPHTILSNVHKLEPGTMLVYDGEIKKKSFWKPTSASLVISEEDAAQKLDELLATSISRQLVADVPLGVFLSGGIDSSTIAHYAARSSSQINTFSIGFEDYSFDESEYARAAAKHIGTSHHELVMREKDALELLDSLPEVFSEPVADASVIPTMFLSRFARQSVTVALGGDGGDELFAGYPTFQADGPYNLYKHIPSPVRRVLKHGINMLPASHVNFPLSYNLKKFVSSDSENQMHRHLEWLGTFNKENREALLGTASTAVFKDADAYAKEFRGAVENKILFAYMRTYLMDQVLVKVDRASMHYALETRAPFLDHTVVDFVLSLPFSLKYRRGKTKYILKQLMRNKLPADSVDRKKKGFGIPLARWLTGPLKPLAEELLSPRTLKTHGLFNENYVAALMSDHFEKRRDNRKELWNLMVFQMWFNRWMR